MEEPVATVAHSLVGNLKRTQQKDKGSEEGTNGRNIPKEKLLFDLSEEHDGTAQRKWADANPFEALNGEDNTSDFLRKAPKALDGG
jgi:hypothetical protein